MRVDSDSKATGGFGRRDRFRFSNEIFGVGSTADSDGVGACAGVIVGGSDVGDGVGRIGITIQPGRFRLHGLRLDWLRCYRSYFDRFELRSSCRN